MRFNFKITESHYEQLQSHLFPGDGKEAVTVALCGTQILGDQYGLLVHKLLLIPYTACSVRTATRVTWSTDSIRDLLLEASKKKLSLVKIHSHPNGLRDFSETDDNSDLELFDSVGGWIDDVDFHASLILLPDGTFIGRTINANLVFEPISKFTIVGDEIKVTLETDKVNNLDISKRIIQTFGLGTTALLASLKVGVVGCSGTGSIVIEQLARLGIGQLVLIDPDKVEKKNLNRILNTTWDDAINEKLKVDVLANSINKIGFNTQVSTYPSNLYDSPDAIKDLASCDILFGCVDSVDGRHLLNQIATFYLIPYFDLGVKILADGNGGIEQICSTIHYIKPGAGSLKSRGVYTDEELRAAGLLRIDLDEYNKQKKSGYIVNVQVDSPAVISINMQTASMAVNEFLARIHNYRYDHNSEFAITRLSLNDGYVQYQKDNSVDEYLLKYCGRGTINPLLNMPEIE